MRTPLLRPLALVVSILLSVPLAIHAEEGDATTVGLEAARVAWDAARDDIVAGMALQDALVAAGRDRESKKLFRTAKSSAPDSAALAFLYGRALGGPDGIRRMKKALDSGLDGASVAQEQRVAAWRGLRDAQIEANEFAAAEKAARIAVRLGSDAHDWTLLAWILERSGDMPGAAAAYDLAVKRREDHLWARNALALLRAKLGEHEPALALAKSTVEKFPDDAGAHLHLGLVACLAGDVKLGRTAYADALRCAGRDADTLAAVATAYVGLEDYELAQEALLQALRIDPKHGRALVAFGVLALEREQPENAVEFLQRAVKVRRDDARAWYVLGVCQQRIEKAGLAVLAFRKATRLEPENVDYQIALAMAQAAKGAVDDGIYTLKRAAKAAPSRSDVQLQLAFLQMKRKRYRDAAKTLHRAADLATEDPRPYFYLAIIYGDHLSKQDDARSALETYESLGGKDPAALRWLADLRAKDG